MRKLRILAFYSAKHWNSPDVFPKGSMCFPDQPRYPLYLSVPAPRQKWRCLPRSESALSHFCISSLPRCWQWKVYDGPWPVSEKAFSLFLFVAHFSSICTLCSSTSFAYVDFLSRMWSAIVSANFVDHLTIPAWALRAAF